MDMYDIVYVRDTLCVCVIGWIHSYHVGGVYVLSVLRSSALEAQKVAALQTAEIRSAQALYLCGEFHQAGPMRRWY